MKHIGILTFHHVHNFGAVLQTWSLSHSLRAMGYRADVIDYRPPDAHTVQSRRGIKALIPSLGKMRMDRFVRREIPLTGAPLTTFDALTAHIAQTPYDALVCGSDQVWFTPGTQTFNPAYFLDFPDSTARKLSYAPSSGPDQDFGPLTDQIAPALTRFDAVSVRDRNTMAAVNTLGIDPITRVVDPTLIADFSSLTQPRKGGEFIAVLGKMDAAADRYIRFAAAELGLPVIAFGTRCNGADTNRPYASPGDWLNAISQARLVITSLFHGAAISLSLRTPFVALDCGGRAFKLEDLCDYLTVPERLLIRADGAPDYAQDPDLLAMDYAPIEDRLRQTAEDSRTYLKEAVDG